MQKKQLIQVATMAGTLSAGNGLAQIIDLSNLGDTTPGVIINGINRCDSSGTSISGSGDFNGDEIPDILIGAPSRSSCSSVVLGGQAFLILGGTDLPSILELSDIGNELPGLQFNGMDGANITGRSVSMTADINGDGLDDLVVGAPYVSSPTSEPGQIFVVFGDSNLTGIVDASQLGNTIPGLIINGVSASSRAGFSVSGAGDINGDGIDDVVIGAYLAINTNGRRSGQSYVLFGDSALNGTIEASELGSSIPGIIINGEGSSDFSGISVSGAGDINNDGIDDIVIGADRIDTSEARSGRSYVLFGDTELNGLIELSQLGSGLPGITFDGVSAGDLSGSAVSNAGDVNGDSIDDLAIGAPLSSVNGISSGQSYLIFGSSTLNGNLQLDAIGDSIPGVTFNGDNGSDFSGVSLSSAGDINADGIGDLLIGASGVSSNAFRSGQAYAIFGSSQLNGFVELSDVASTVPGLVLNGSRISDYAGRSVSNAGDINTDGFDDVLVGAPSANVNDVQEGRSYLIYGAATTDLSIDISDGQFFINNQDTITYSITISNLGPANAEVVFVQSILPATLDGINAIWSCIPTGQASCSANGSGNLSDIASIPVQDAVTYSLTANVLAQEGDFIVSTATVMPQGSLFESNPTNNTAVDTSFVAIFADGMENQDD